MRPGTVVKLSDGRVGTVVYHGLDGYGIVWGNRKVDVELVLSADSLFRRPPPGYPRDLFPEAMLREPYEGADLPCVGDDYVVAEAESLSSGDAQGGPTR